MSRLPSRPCLAMPFTILSGPDRVRLIAGEDFRYTMNAPGLETWLPDFLPKVDGRLPLEQLLITLPEDLRSPARQLLARLYGERVLVEGPTDAAHRAGSYSLEVEGDGQLCSELVSQWLATDSDAVRHASVLCQDRLDYAEALAFNEKSLQGGNPWFWLTVGPLNRGYVSPVFLPDAGPCLGCLLTHFRRLSPAPELYDDLIDRARQGKAIRPVTFPLHGITILHQLLLWKIDLLRERDAPAALFQLHVLEVSSLEVTAHRVFRDPECAACSGKR